MRRRVNLGAAFRWSQSGWRRVRQTTAFRIARMLVLYLLAAGALFWWAERRYSPSQPVAPPLFGPAGPSAWAPDYGCCPTCGAELVPQLDELSACRRCEHCQVSYRHPSLPPTLEQQERAWK